MDIPRKTADVGVIVGRFQVPYLHDAHKDLIDTVSAAHSKVIIFLGVAPAKTTYHNPLDFECRKQMILELYKDAIVLPIRDTKSDEVWSRNLDSQISDIIGPNQTVLLYGGRDSFISHYRGKFATQELVPASVISGSELRKLTSNRVKASTEFREGVVWATANQWPKVWPTVDVAVIKRDAERSRSVLLCRKPDESDFMFIGGFVDPRDDSYEIAAVREVMEECGIEVSPPVYVCSTRIDDWRYQNGSDRITTAFFVCDYLFGGLSANDDIAEARWVNLEDLYNAFLINPLSKPPVPMAEGHRKSLLPRLYEFTEGKKIRTKIKTTTRE